MSISLHMNDILDTLVKTKHIVNMPQTVDVNDFITNIRFDVFVSESFNIYLPINRFFINFLFSLLLFINLIYFLLKKLEYKIMFFNQNFFQFAK